MYFGTLFTAGSDGMEWQGVSGAQVSLGHLPTLAVWLLCHFHPPIHLCTHPIYPTFHQSIFSATISVIH